MPSQPLSRFASAPRYPASTRVPARSFELRRFLVLGTAAALTAFATNEMRLALSVGHLSVVAVLVLVLFVVNFAWISLPLAGSVVGFFRILGRNGRESPKLAKLSSRTALLMPTFNEDPARAAAALEAMARELVALGEGHSFHIFLLSDSTDGDIALAEQEALRTLRRRLGDAMQVYYRRRTENIAHKPGNIRDFCERWGSEYDHLLTLDVDSLIDGATIVRLTQRMEADPTAGIIQTLPRLHRGTTLLARVQQFAGTVYGRLLGEGLAWWAGNEAPFWGHNAIIRREAFMASAGLPVLPGAPPFGGPILSHDFVEAALLRRRGWSVSIDSDLVGSYEEGPSSLADQAVRDRRWCQGNLQHARILAANGLHWVSRLHLVAGIMSYLSSPLWLLFVASALALGVQYEFARQQYFTHASTLFPFWPRIDPARAARIFFITMGVLFGPKLLGFLSVALSRRRLREHGGVLHFSLSLVFEILVSALIAPVLALIHCGIVADVLRGRDSGWHAQRREGAGVSWRAALGAHRWHMVAGLALALVAYKISWHMLAWLTPAVVGMVLAGPLAKFVSSLRVGRLTQGLGILRTPEETRVPPVALAAEAAIPVYREAIGRTPGLADIVRNPELLARHLAFTDRVPARARGSIVVIEAVAEYKIRVATTLEEAVATLTPEERGRVQAVPSLLLTLADLTTSGSTCPIPTSRRWSHAPERVHDSSTTIPDPGQ